VRVFVNDTEITVADGMTVHHAITALTGGSTDFGRWVVQDRWGNSIGLDGALREDDRILTFPKKQ
jgi:sulfur carrier protein ThiS